MAGFDAMIHQPVRLRIMASLASLGNNEAIEFTYLRDTLELSDGNLGAHLRKLEEAGYVTAEKTFVDRKPKTYLELTGQGRRAFEEHVRALTDLLKNTG